MNKNKHVWAMSEAQRCQRPAIRRQSLLFLIGTVPLKELKAVKIGKKRKYASEDISIVHFGIDKGLFFGFKTVDGVN